MLPSNNKTILIKNEELGKYERLYKIINVKPLNSELLLLTIDLRLFMMNMSTFNLKGLNPNVKPSINLNE